MTRGGACHDPEKRLTEHAPYCPPFNDASADVSVLGRLVIG